MLDDSVIDDGPEADHVLPDGIYFDLDEKIYHSLHRLSASGLKDMDISPSNYWQRSYHNPDKSDVTTPAMIVGKAAHTARLEPEKFTSLFAVKPSKDDFEQLLTTGPEIAAALEERGEKKNVAGERVLEKALRLKESGYGGNIWHLIELGYEETRRGRDGISAAAFAEIQRDAAILRRNPEVADYITGGAAEVSILWTDKESGLKMKCRIDYLKVGSFTDIKNFANMNAKSIGRLLVKSFQYNRHHMQAAFYFTPLEGLRSGELDLPIVGEHTPEQATIIEGIKAAVKPVECVFIFMQKGGVPNVLLRKIDLVQPIAGVVEQMAGAKGAGLALAWKKPVWTRLMCRAMGDIWANIEKYQRCLELFPNGEEWQSLDMVGAISSEDFPPWFLDVYGV